MQRVKKKLCIKSVYKDDDWYWTLPRGEEGVDHAKGRDSSNTTGCNDDYGSLRSDDYDDETTDYRRHDETPVMYLDDAVPCVKNAPDTAVASTPTQNSAICSNADQNVIMSSSFGELRLIEWRVGE